MIQTIRKKRGANVVEYMALVAVIVSMIVFFRWFILRKFWGQWKKAGDVFSHGRQYDPRSFGPQGASGGTLACFQEEVEEGVWYWISEKCFEDHCQTECLADPSDVTAGACDACKIDCSGTGATGQGDPYYAGLCAGN